MLKSLILVSHVLFAQLVGTYAHEDAGNNNACPAYYSQCDSEFSEWNEYDCGWRCECKNDVIGTGQECDNGDSCNIYTECWNTNIVTTCDCYGGTLQCAMPGCLPCPPSYSETATCDTQFETTQYTDGCGVRCICKNIVIQYEGETCQESHEGNQCSIYTNGDYSETEEICECKENSEGERKIICCPAPEPYTACNEIYAPVICGENECEYGNECWADASGQDTEDCTLVWMPSM